MSEKNAGSYLHYSIDTYTYLLRKDQVSLPVVILDKASVCGDRKTSFSFLEKSEFINIGIFAASSGGRKGRCSRGLRQIGRDHMYDKMWGFAERLICFP